MEGGEDVPSPKWKPVAMISPSGVLEAGAGAGAGASTDAGSGVASVVVTVVVTPDAAADVIVVVTVGMATQCSDAVEQQVGGGRQKKEKAKKDFQ